MADTTLWRVGSVLRAGASSGWGQAFALAGRAQASGSQLHLWLTGRNANCLAGTAASAADLGADVSTAVMDVRDEAVVKDWVLGCDDAKPLDMVIPNAGQFVALDNTPESAETVRMLVETNVFGVINTVIPAAARMRGRYLGRIVIVSSLAGRLPFPSTPTYSATKAFVRRWGLSRRPDLARYGIGLAVASPGYIATPMTAQNQFRMPFIVSADWAVDYILRRLDNNPAEIALPSAVVLAIRLLSLLSQGLFERLMR